MAEANHIMNAFRTNRNNPKVIMVIGMVINTITGNKKLLSKAITMASLPENSRNFLLWFPVKWRCNHHYYSHYQ